MPVVGIFAADAGKVRAGTLAAPLERLVVHALCRERVMAVPLDLVAQRPDHLRVADVAAFTHIDIAARKLEGRVRPHPVDLFDGVLQIEEWNDFHETTDRNHNQNADHENDRVFFENGVF